MSSGTPLRVRAVTSGNAAWKISHNVFDVDGENQREEPRVEQLEWLAAQTQLLQDIRRHTGFMYNLLVFSLVLTIVGLAVWTFSFIAAVV
jgi:hypothetical protein